MKMEPIKFTMDMTELAKDQPEYNALPIARAIQPDGTKEMISCWQLSLWERVKVLVTGKLYLRVVGTQHPPVDMTLDNPVVSVENEVIHE